MEAPAKPAVGDLVGQEVAFDEAHYRLEKLLGAGGMGEVYLARRVVESSIIQWTTADLAAVKVVRRDIAAVFGEDVKAFADEARLHWHLNHPNVVPVRGVTEADGTLYVLMEYLEGHDLRILLKVGTRLSEGAVCNVLTQVADALDYVHRATDESGTPLHIVHRDVSPSNIRVTAAGVVKLMDFGLAMHDADWREKTRSSWSGFKGKPMYLSPEQVNRQPLDGRADLFALGCILVECLTGRRLFDGDQEALILHAIQNVTPGDVEKALQGVPEGLKVICHKLLARDREERYSAGKDVAEALRQWAFFEMRYTLDSRTLAHEVEELVSLEDEEDTPPPLEQPSVRSRPPRVAVVALILAALVLVAVSLSRLRPPSSPPVERNPMPTPSPSPEPPVIEEPRLLSPVKKPLTSAAKCAGLSLAAAIAAGCPPVHVPTHTRTGDCTVQAPPRDIGGHKVPEILPVYFVSLNGEQCKGLPPRPGATCEHDPNCCDAKTPTCWKEPCPAGEGRLVMISNHNRNAEVPIPEEFFQEALLYGKARIEPESAVIEEWGEEPRNFTSRTLALFTEMVLKNGTTVPICGVLYQGAFESTRSGTLKYGEIPPAMNKEGLPVLAREYFGAPATPTATPYIRLYWP